MQEYQLYIDGEFGPAKSGKSVDSINPATEEPWARVARAGRVRWRSLGAHEPAGPGQDPERHRRPHAGARTGDRCHRDAGLRRHHPEDRRRPHARERAAALLRGDGGADSAAHRDPGAAISGAVDELRAARAVRRLRPDHPVELPPDDGGVEARTSSSPPPTRRARCSSWRRSSTSPTCRRAWSTSSTAREPSAARSCARARWSTRSPSRVRPPSGAASCSSPRER